MGVSPTPRGTLMIFAFKKTRRRQLERRWRRSQLPADRCAFVNQSSLVKNLVFNAKISFYSTLIHDAGTDSHALFKTIDRLLHRKPDKRLPYYSSSFELANRFAAFFKEKIDNLRSELPDVAVPDYFAALDTPTLSCSLEYFSPTTIHELSQIARRVGSKSCSLDPLPPSTCFI